ncbi:pentapeptide repeat protein [Stanieria sp. NIES-3757]|nr:pentapeptide repeat protein [Stanieria sp. NIES-3757]
MNNLTTFKAQYQQGEKNFANINLRQADLRGINLSQINLQGCDLTQANLTNVCLDEANLDNANLTEAILDQASLIKTSLNKANLTKASLIKTKLVRASLNEAILSQANLTNAFLTISYFNKALFTGASLKQTSINGALLLEADLTDADLLGANVRNTKFDSAYYNINTLFDADFDPIKFGMQKILAETEITISLLTKTFNSLYQISQHYLGNQMATRYWQSSRPDFDWLKQFHIDSLGQISFLGGENQVVSQENLKYYKIWLDSFIKSCSHILQDFSEIITRKQLIDVQLEVFLNKNL